MNLYPPSHDAHPFAEWPPSQQYDMLTPECSSSEEDYIPSSPPSPHYQTSTSYAPVYFADPAQNITQAYLHYDIPPHHAPQYEWGPPMSEVYHSSPVTPSSPCDSEQLIYPPSIPLHHPIPVSYLPPLSASPDSTSEYEPFPAESSSVHTMDRLHFEYQNLPDSYLGDRYPAAPANLFPTPSELLTEMSSREASQRAQAQIDGYESNSRKPESQRKARQRVVAETIGFTQTDPDSISSHDKKRYYLESLEQYVLYLQDQFRLLEHTPVALERVSTYRGLSSRSVRTLLVHMEGEVKKANDKTSEEERLFVDLRDQLVSQEASAAAQPFRRYSAP